MVKGNLANYGAGARPLPYWGHTGKTFTTLLQIFKNKRIFYF